ncbi:unnamed protein product [Dovyalis caffra]|uniref:Uncharacterized protein n=1 Tax=Dovyalis caffra TaxID=77055 RepID=A0AAV1R7B2_9ROSI|nr:unnamed protein product [Dovyalis caffra]
MKGLFDTASFGDIEFVGGNVGGSIGGNVGGSIGTSEVNGDGFGGFIGSVDAEMLGDTAGAIGISGDANCGADVGGVEVRLGGNGGILGLGNGGTSLAFGDCDGSTDAEMLGDTAGDNARVTGVSRDPNCGANVGGVEVRLGGNGGILGLGNGGTSTTFGDYNDFLAL